jgi:DDB1- and CUL4-associated factor 11
MMDNLSSAISSPLSLFGPHRHANPDEIFNTGDIDLREDEILETDRSEEGEVDDSPEKYRPIRVVGVTKEEEAVLSQSAKKRRQWTVTPLRVTKHKRIGH